MNWSWTRWWGMVCKEFLQLKRDRVTFGMIIGLPVVQLILFGYAINADPRQLPTAVLLSDHSEITRSFVAAMAHSDYFKIVGSIPDEAAAERALAQGKVQFVLHIPADFTRELLRGGQPEMLLEADATDPAATGMALGAVQQIAQAVIVQERALQESQAAGPAFSVNVHRHYNPEGITQYNVVPGLMGVILTLTMVMMTGLAMTRERERGTMENLLATPVTPLEVMSGKIIPYVLIGLVQSSIILLAAYWAFSVPFQGSLFAVYCVTLIYVATSLTVGITLSSLAQNQLQAMQLTIFYFMPNLLLSGFMFPFNGMPAWARAIGEILPLTHFNRLIRGILLKGNSWVDLWPDIWPLFAFASLIMLIALKFYRRTLD
ncbi:ABC transporter permease [Iodobacter fluviatilis]|uniref:ABC-2 type transport system permease protein n=1 Tax=Iodobacter fluviatilis TaxID=537 RepID=A0A377Q335_9NEIS|nr:ABC transporter permease [Iodobacter fluviatilis]TCU84083.1 ABC-2 type transport system permease protein [Iodobacter fluviatilis]STQ89696.1 Inner membrane transport permease ybhS [Iodobacter fluviatilis]